jgi:hypothetical protein
MSLPLPPPRNPGSPGWYVDPDAPQRERWWTGTEWTTAIAPLARGPFGPDFERSMRPAINRLASAARFVAFGAIVALLLAVIDGSLLGPGAPSVLSVVGLVAAFVLGAAGAVLGFVALRRAELQGGGGAARASIVLGVAAIGLGVFASLVR